MDIFQGAHEGVFHFRGGEVAFLMIDYEKGAPGEVGVRYESGWYARYRPDGTRVSAGGIVNPDGTFEVIYDQPGHKRDIVKFEPMSWKEAKIAYTDGIAGELCP